MEEDLDKCWILTPPQSQLCKGPFVTLALSLVVITIPYQASWSSGVTGDLSGNYYWSMIRSGNK